MLEFLREMTRRKVWVFGGLYIGLAWVLFQVSMAIETTLALPNWVDQTALVLLALGFPVVLLLAWAQESVSAHKTSDKQSEAKNYEEPGGPDDLSIVVLPFRARAGDEIEQLTAEGLTDDITALLTPVKGLKVVPRMSVGRNFDDNDDALQNALQLGGRYALTGSVRRIDDRLRVSAELTEIKRREQKWSQQFDRPADDIFSIQDEIARGVVSIVGGVILRVESERALRLRPENLRAWELTRRATSTVWDWRPQTVHQGVLDLRRAVEFDPHYALAHGWLSILLAWRATSGWTDEIETEREEALREADETVRLGQDDGEALMAVLSTYWIAQEPERCVSLYERTIARQPDIFLAWPHAISCAGVGFARMGRGEEGLRMIYEVGKTYPDDAVGSIWNRVMAGYAELSCRKYDEVADTLIDSPSEFDGMCRVIALMHLGQIDEAKAVFSRKVEANPDLNLDHYIEYFKGYHSTDQSVGEELSQALVKLKSELTH